MNLLDAMVRHKRAEVAAGTRLLAVPPSPHRDFAAVLRQPGLSVIADVHTHPTGAGQSPSDRDNPMVAQAGHVAIIVPNYARVRVWRHRLGLYRYRGAHQWDNLSGWSARHTLRTGTWT